MSQPYDRPQDPSGPQGYPQQQPTYPSQQPGAFDASGPAPSYGQPPHGQHVGQPMQGYGQMPPAPAGGFGQAPTTRPGMVTAAGVLAIVVGGLGLLLGLIGLSLISTFSGLHSLVFVLVLIVAAVEIWGGIQVLNGKDARILTIAAGVGIVLNLVSLLGAFDARSLLSFVIPGLILYFLLNPQSRAWFDRVGAKHF